MPEKEGAEEKTTKSVVNKKQKQMMGEEGYDIARDMGRVRPSKDKKDATTMPPSKEMEKTRKVNKGPSALERVKADIEKKYGKDAIMKVGKKKANEELDLTQVAEAFGGFIVEAPVDSEGNIKPNPGDAGRERRLINKEIKKLTSPKPGEKKSAKQTVQKFIKSTKITQRSAGATGRMDSRNPKMGGGASSADLSPEPGDKRKLDNTTFGGPVKIIKKGVKKPKVTVVQTKVKDPKAPQAAKDFKKQLGSERIVSATMQDKLEKTIKKGRKPRGLPSWARQKPLTPERQKAVDSVKKGIETRQILNPDRRSRTRVSPSGTTFKLPKQKSVKTPPVSTQPLLSPKKIAGLLNPAQTKPRTSSPPPPPDPDPIPDPWEDNTSNQNQNQNQNNVIDFEKEREKRRNRNQSKPKPKKTKTVADKRLQRVRIAAKKAKRTGVKTAKYLKKNPLATLVGAGVAKDTFFPVKIPKPPTVQGGKVGRRTAG